MLNKDDLELVRQMFLAHGASVHVGLINEIFQSEIGKNNDFQLEGFCEALLKSLDISGAQLLIIPRSGLKKELLPVLACSSIGKVCLIKAMSADGTLSGIYENGAEISDDLNLDEFYSLNVPRLVFNTNAGRLIIDLYKEHHDVLKQVVSASVVVNLLALFTSLFANLVYDRVIPNSSLSTLWVLALGLSLASIFDFLLRTARSNALDEISKTVEDKFSAKIFQKIIHTPIDHVPQGSGSFVAQFNSFDQARAFFGSVLLFTIVDIPFLVVFLVFIGFISLPIALVYFIAAPLLIALGYAGFKTMKNRQDAQLVASFERSGVLNAVVDNFEWVKSTQSTWHFANYWDRITSEISEWTLKTRSITAMMSTAVAVLNTLIYMAAIVVGVYCIEGGLLTVGGLIACTIVGGRILNPLSNMIPIFQQLAVAKTSLSSIDKVFKLPGDQVNHLQTVVLPKDSDFKIEAKNLVYSYGANHPWALRINQILINPGNIFALIGSNGSGKSTLLRILAGLVQASQGRVRLNDVDMAHINHQNLREIIAYLPQEIRLFKGTIRENLTIGLGHVSDHEVIELAKKIGLMESLLLSHKSIMDPIRESGSGVSGGQRQLIGLVRVMLSGAKVLVLDEPTSFLDNQSEKMVMNQLQELASSGCTIVITTHKQSVLQYCSGGAVMQGGQIVQELSRKEPEPNVPNERMIASNE